MTQNYLTKTELVDSLEQGMDMKGMSQFFDITQSKLRQLRDGKLPPRTRIPMGKHAELWERED